MQKPAPFTIRLGKRHRRVLQQYARAQRRAGTRRFYEVDSIRAGIELLVEKMKQEKEV